MTDFSEFRLVRLEGGRSKVHDAQAELLRAIGADGNLPELIGQKLASASEKVSSLVASAEKVEANAKSISDGMASLKKSIKFD